MPFKSESQRRKCYALKAKGRAGSWDCDEWESVTPKDKKLPEAVDKVAAILTSEFSKIAKKLFNPIVAPPVPIEVEQKNVIESAKQEKMKGMTPIEYRNQLSMKSKGIVARNKQTTKAT